VLRRASLGLGVAIVLADGSIVSLALPRMLVDLHTTVVGVAAVLFVYMAVLAGSVWLGVRYASRIDLRQLVCGGFALVALAGLLCALADSLGVMLLGRVLGAIGGGIAAVGAFGLIDGAGTGRRAWLLASVLGAMVGPALGGVLTQLFAWRSIFVVQIPIAAVAGAGALYARGARSPVSGSGSAPEERFSRVAAAAAGLVSAALSAVLFLLVLMIITGWDISPLRAAVAVSVLPVAALLGVRVQASPEIRLVAGSGLIGAGILALAWLPEPTIAWTLAPQALAGFGAGMAMPALAGELLPQDNARQAAGLLSIRHAAIALTLVAVAPVIAHQLNSGVREAQLKGIALVLDAKLSPAQKFSLAPPLFAAVQSDRPRSSLRAAFAAHRSSFSGSNLVAYDELASRSQDLLTGIVKRGFRPAFVIAGLLALLAAALSVLLLT
jgi:predicted MFS family arabinose efflux permease